MTLSGGVYSNMRVHWLVSSRASISPLDGAGEETHPCSSSQQRTAHRRGQELGFRENKPDQPGLGNAL